MPDNLLATVNRRLRSENGSLPLAMLAVLIVGSLVSMLVASTIVGQRQSRFDQGFEQSLQVAEVGLDRLVAMVESREVETLPEFLAAGGGDLVISRQGTADGGEWSAEAVWDATDRSWTITATGRSPLGELRSAQMRMDVSSLFDVAAFGKFFIDFNGDNVVDSYRSGRFVEDAAGEWIFDASLGDSRICTQPMTIPVTPCAGDRVEQVRPPESQNIRMWTQEGQGVAATNGALFIKGQTFNQIDGWAEVHYTRAGETTDVPDPLPGATGHCKGVNAVCAAHTPGDPTSRLRYFRDELVLPYDPVVPPVTPEGSFNGYTTWACDRTPEAGRGCLGPGSHVFTDVNLFTDCELVDAGLVHGADPGDKCTYYEGTPDDPTVVFLVGMLKVPSRDVVNFTVSDDNYPEPKSPLGLLIFSAGTGPAIDFRNFAAVSAGIYAPNGGATGGAQVNIFGSLIAGSINNNGGWSFHYDVALGDLNIQSPLLASDWTEVSEHLSMDG